MFLCLMTPRWWKEAIPNFLCWTCYEILPWYLLAIPGNLVKARFTLTCSLIKHWSLDWTIIAVFHGRVNNSIKVQQSCTPLQIGNDSELQQCCQRRCANSVRLPRDVTERNIADIAEAAASDLGHKAGIKCILLDIQCKFIRSTGSRGIFLLKFIVR